MSAADHRRRRRRVRRRRRDDRAVCRTCGIATPAAKTAFLFTRVGLAGCDMGACAMLPRVIGQGRAAELLFTGRTMSAEEGERWGFFNRIVASRRAGARRDRARASSLAEGPTFAHMMTKTMLNQEWSMTLDQAIEAEAQAQALCMQTQDFKRAYEAFVAKQKPQFSWRLGALEQEITSTQEFGSAERLSVIFCVVKDRDDAEASIALGPTAHVDTFTRDHLPPLDQWPDLLLDRPEFQYPEYLNVAVELTDRMVEKGFGDHVALIGNGRRRTYKELTDWTNRLAHSPGRGLRRQARQPRAHSIRQQPRDGGGRGSRSPRPAPSRSTPCRCCARAS